MQENFEASVQYVLNDEGGYAERSNEPGGACNKGISFQLFQEVWNKDPNFKYLFYGVRDDTQPTFDELKGLTDEAAKFIYQYYVFNLVGFSELPVGLDYAMVNTGTMQGPTGAIRLLQNALEVPVTGKLDQTTLDKIAETDTYEIIGGLLLYQAQAKMHDPRVGPFIDDKGKQQKGFGNGWSDRIIRVWNRSRKMLDDRRRKDASAGKNQPTT